MVEKISSSFVPRDFAGLYTISDTKSPPPSALGDTSKSRSDPDFKQKTDRDFTLWCILPNFIHPSIEKETEIGLDQICSAKKTKKRPERVTKVTNSNFRNL